MKRPFAKNSKRILDVINEKDIAVRVVENAFDLSIAVKTQDFKKLMTALKEDLSFFYLVDISGYDDGHIQGPQLVYHLLQMQHHWRLRITVRPSAKKEIPSVEALWPSARWHERELFDFWGVKAGNNGQRLILPKNFIGHPLCAKGPLEKDFKGPSQEEVEEFISFGQFGMAKITENGYVGKALELTGKTVDKVELLFGSEHQAIEKLCEGKEYGAALKLISRANTQQQLFFAQLWCALLEKMFQIKASERSQVLRMVIIELGRIAEHLKNFAMISRILEAEGYSVFPESLFKKMHLLVESMCPQYGLFQFLPGGLLEDIPFEWRGECSRALMALEKELTAWEKAILQSVKFKQRMSVDRITGKEALDLGLSGPALKACGLNYDLRKTNPYYFYGQVEFEVPLGLYGSGYDRFLIRLLEIKQSMGILHQLLDNLPMRDASEEQVRDTMDKGEGLAAWENFFQAKSPLDREIYFAQEGPNGETGYYLVGSKNNRISRLKIRTPSFHHAQAFEEIAKGLDIEDLPVVQGSLNFYTSEIER